MKKTDSLETSAALIARRRQSVKEICVKLLEDIYMENTATINLHKSSENIPIQKGARQGDTILLNCSWRFGKRQEFK